MTNKAIGSNFCSERYSLIPKKIDIEELFRVLAFQYFRLLPGGIAAHRGGSTKRGRNTKVSYC